MHVWSPGMTSTSVYQILNHIIYLGTLAGFFSPFNITSEFWCYISWTVWNLFHPKAWSLSVSTSSRLLNFPFDMREHLQQLPQWVNLDGLWPISRSVGQTQISTVATFNVSLILLSFVPLSRIFKSWETKPFVLLFENCILCLRFWICTNTLVVPPAAPVTYCFLIRSYVCQFVYLCCILYFRI